ncbi:PRD domain-containing protein [Streptococcus suis]|nr:PRD domain-containing protein [Streptococcus suis]
MKRKLNYEILRYLKKQTSFITSDKIALDLEVSKITVVRHITAINANYDEPIIISERGRGYKLNTQIYIQKNLHLGENSNEERCIEIIKELLFVAPKRLRTMEVYERFYVSEAVIAKDKYFISNKLKKWNLSFVRSSRHIAIIGAERDIRAAIMELVLNLSRMTDISALEEYCNGINNNRDFLFTIQQIEFASTALGTNLVYPYNISLFAHIYVLLERIRKYRYVSEHNETIHSFKESKFFSPEIYSICKQIIANISDYIGFQPNELEVTYLYDYLSSTRLSEQLPLDADDSLSQHIARSYIDKVSTNTGRKFSFQLLKELESHIHYMVQRLFNKVYLPNALLHEIQSEYSALHNIICTVSTDISSEYSLPDIPEDESGFICLYFAKYFELERKKVNAYIVCTTGVGTSELIAVKIRQSLPEINIVGVTSNAAIAKMGTFSEDSVDLIITTIPIKHQIDIPVVLVSSILTNRDIESISNVKREIIHGK